MKQPTKKLNTQIAVDVWEPGQDWVESLGTRRCIENTLGFVNYLEELLKSEADTAVISRVRADIAMGNYQRVIDMIQRRA